MQKLSRYKKIDELAGVMLDESLEIKVRAIAAEKLLKLLDKVEGSK